MKTTKQQSKPEKPRTAKNNKKRAMTPDTDEQSIDEESENFVLGQALKELIVIDNGKVMENFDEKVRNGDYEEGVNRAIKRCEDRKEWKDEDVKGEVIRAQKKAVKHLIKTGMVEENNVKVPDVTSSDSSSSGDEKTLKKMRDKAKLPHCKDCPKHTSFCADCIAAKQDKEEEEKGFRRRAVYGDLVPLTTKKSRVTKKKVDVKLKNPPSKSPQNSALDISRNSASSSRSMSFNFSNRRNTGPNLRSLNDSAMQSDKSSVKFESNLVSVGTQTDATCPINSTDSKENTLKPNSLGVRV